VDILKLIPKTLLNLFSKKAEPKKTEQKYGGLGQDKGAMTMDRLFSSSMDLNIPEQKTVIKQPTAPAKSVRDVSQGARQNLDTRTLSDIFKGVDTSDQGYTPYKNPLRETIAQLFGEGKRKSVLLDRETQKDIRSGAATGLAQGVAQSATFGWWSPTRNFKSDTERQAADVTKLAGTIAAEIGKFALGGKAIDAVARTSPYLVKAAQIAPKTWKIFTSGLNFAGQGQLQKDLADKTIQERSKRLLLDFTEGGVYSLAALDPSWWKSAGIVAPASFTLSVLRGNDMKQALTDTVVNTAMDTAFFLAARGSHGKATDQITREAREESAKFLNVSPDSSPDQIRKAWRSKVAQVHPDKASALGRSEQELRQEFIKAQRAYEFLTKSKSPAALTEKSLFKEWKDLYGEIFREMPTRANALAKSNPELHRAYMLATQGGFIAGSNAKDWDNLPGKFSNRIDQKPRAQVSDADARLVNVDIEKGGSGMLGNFLQHEKLYAQYPALKNTRVRFNPSQPAGTASLVPDPEDPFMIVGTAGGTVDDARKSVLHETQHIIQAIEGFSQGSTPGNAEAKAWLQAGGPAVKSQLDRIKLQNPGASETELAKRMMFDLYERYGGEIEARAVVDLADVPQDKLPAIDPYATQGIPLEEVVDRMGVSGEAEQAVDQLKADPNVKLVWNLPGQWVPAKGKPTWNHSKMLWNLMRNTKHKNAIDTDVTQAPLGAGMASWIIDTLQSGSKNTEPIETYLRDVRLANKAITRGEYRKLYAIFKARDYDIDGYKEVVGRLLGIKPDVIGKPSAAAGRVPYEPLLSELEAMSHQEITPAAVQRAMEIRDQLPAEQKAQADVVVRLLQSALDPQSGAVAQAASPEQLGDIARRRIEEIRNMTPADPGRIDPENPPEGMKLRGFPETVRDDPGTPPALAETVGTDQAHYYRVMPNKETMATARAYIEINGENAALQYAMNGNDTQANAVAMTLIGDYLARGDLPQAELLYTKASPRFTAQGQAIQILAQYSKFTPAGAFKHAQNVIEKAQDATPGKAKKLKERTKQITDDLNKTNDDAVDQVIKDIDGELQKIVGSERAPSQPRQQPGTQKPAVGDLVKRPKASGDPAEMLAERIARYVTPSKPPKPLSEMTDEERAEKEIRDMVNTLFQVSQEALPTPTKRPPADPLQKVVEAIKDRDRFIATWQRAKPLVEEKLRVQDPELLARIEDYLAYDPDQPDLLNRPFANRQLERAIQDRMKKLKINLGNLVRGYYKTANQERLGLQKQIIAETDLNPEQAEYLSTYIQRRFDELTRVKKEQILKQMFGHRPTPKKKELYERIIEMSNLGAMSTADLRPAVAQKLGMPYFTPEVGRQIVNYANQIQDLPADSWERVKLTAKMMDLIAAQVPAELGQKIATIQTMAQLLNPKTLIRNVVGNTFFTMLENAADVLGTAIDIPASVITGQRSKVLPDAGVQVRGAAKGMRLGFEDAVEGIDTSKAPTKYDLPNRTFRTGPLGTLEKLLNISLRATDRAAFVGAYEGSLNNQMRAAGVKEATEEMKKVATADALYRTFQDNSALAQTFTVLKNKVFNRAGIKGFGLGDLILKYPKTPANILARGLDYSPAGFVKTIYELVRPTVGEGPEKQKKFVENLSRSLIGSGLIFTGYILGKVGIITGEEAPDYEIAQAQRELGGGKFKLNVNGLQRFFFSGFDSEAAKPKSGDLLVSYDWNQPMSIQLSMGANAATEAPGVSWLDSFVSQLESGTETLTSQPLLTGISRFFTTLGDENRGGPIGAFADAGASLPSSFVPTLFNQFGQLADNQARNAYDPRLLQQSINQAKRRIPGLRETLPNMLTIFGRPAEQFENDGNSIFNVFFNPAFVSRYKEDPVLQEVIGIYQNIGATEQAPRKVPKKVKINGVDKKLSADELTAYQRYVGVRTQLAFEQLLKTDTFQRQPDEEKAKRMGNILSDINTLAKAELFGDKPKNLKTIKESLGELDTIKGLDIAIQRDQVKDRYQQTRESIAATIATGKYQEAAKMAQDWNKQVLTDIQDIYPLMLVDNPLEAKEFRQGVIFTGNEIRNIARSIRVETVTEERNPTMNTLFSGI